MHESMAATGDRQRNRCISHRVWVGRRDRPRVSVRGYNHEFSLVTIKFVHCHLSNIIIYTFMHGEEDIWDLVKGGKKSGVEDDQRMSGEGQGDF